MGDDWIFELLEKTQRLLLSPPSDLLLISLLLPVLSLLQLEMCYFLGVHNHSERREVLGKGIRALRFSISGHTLYIRWWRDYNTILSCIPIIWSWLCLFYELKRLKKSPQRSSGALFVFNGKERLPVSSKKMWPFPVSPRDICHISRFSKTACSFLHDW